MSPRVRLNPPGLGSNETYDEVDEYDQRGILEGSLRNGDDGLVSRVMIGVVYEHPDLKLAITARFTDAGWIHSPNDNHQAQLARHQGYVPRLVCFGTAEPTLAQRRQKPGRITTDVALAQTLGALACLHDRSDAMMHPALLAELRGAWFKTFELEVLEALSASSVSLGVERRRKTGKSRFIRPDKARRVGRCDDFDEPRSCEWKDRIAKPPSQFSLVSANHKFDVGLDYIKDALNDQLLGKKLWSCELVSFFVGIIAKKTRSDRDLVSHVPLIDYNRSRTGRNAAKNGITKKQLQEHLEGRHRELRHLASDIYQFDHVYGFGLVDNHFFAIALTMKEKKIHIVDSMPTDGTGLERVEKVSRWYKDTLLILISYSVTT